MKESRSAERTPLSKDLIAQAAIRLADEQGLNSVSMRRLAQSLQVEAMSLYHHVANKDALLDYMVDAVFRAMGGLAPGDGWKCIMRARAFSLRSALEKHTWAVGLMCSRRNPGPATLGHIDDALAVLRENGFPVPLAANALSVLDSYVSGFVMQELSTPFDTTGEMIEMTEEILGAGAQEDFPRLTELAVKHVLTEGYSFENEFAFGLDLILDALELRLGGSAE